MTATDVEDLTDDALYAAEPDDIPAGQDFEGEAPWGYTRDRETGAVRPKKGPGRPKKPPGAEELAAAPLVEQPEDRPPAPPGRRRKAVSDADVPMPKGGVIAKGVNRLYRQAGKIIRAMDEDIGQAIIECTRPDPDDPDELTVGEAWEALAKVNPRVRAFLLGAIKGDAWRALIFAHAPIGIALMMKPAVQRMLPWKRLVESLAEPDEDTPEGEGGLPGGMTAADVDDMEETARQAAERMARKAARGMGVKVSEADIHRMAAQAEAMAGQRLTPPYEGHDLPASEADGVPPAFRRQPQRRSRAARKTR